MSVCVVVLESDLVRVLVHMGLRFVGVLMLMFYVLVLMAVVGVAVLLLASAVRMLMSAFVGVVLAHCGSLTHSVHRINERRPPSATSQVEQAQAGRQPYAVLASGRGPSVGW